MSALTGKTKQISGTPSELLPLRQQIAEYLGAQDFGSRLFPTTTGNDPSLQPYRDLFGQNRTQALTQAKESAGNLSGSGLGAIIGRAGQRASVEENAFLANLLEQRRMQDANRFLQLALGFGTAGVGPSQVYHQPGLFNYLGDAATGLASGGFFNPLINRSRTGGATA